MSQTRPEVERSGWKPLLDALTKDYGGYDITMEVLGRGDQTEAEKLPLAYIEYDDKDDVVIVAVGGREARYPVELQHIIEHPRAIYADALPPEVPVAIEVVGNDGTPTLVTIHLRPELPGD